MDAETEVFVKLYPSFVCMRVALKRYDTVLKNKKAGVMEKRS